MKKALICLLLAAVMLAAGQKQVREEIAGWIAGMRSAGENAAEPARQTQELLFASAHSAARDTLDVTLYYRYGQTDVLGAQRTQLDIGREETVAYSIVKHLVEGPDAAHGRLTGVFPQGTRVISVVPEGTTVFVTLSEAFLGQPDGAPADWEDLAIWQEEATIRRWLGAQSIVCSLTEGGRYQRVQLYVSGGDDEIPQRIPLYWFDLSAADPEIVLAACSRDEAAVLTPRRAMQMIADGWLSRDWETVYTLLCAQEGSQMPTLSAFLAQMREADVSLLNMDISGGTIAPDGRTATLVLDGAIRSRDGGDAWIIRESVPLVRAADNWAMTVDTLLSLMIRE